jgi:predicted RNA binding protein YcfA (HicA-like mRNA interferase family)
LKLPRDASGEELARLLERLGYQITRQTGTHMRLTRAAEVEHRITVPRHGVLKVGTLHSIVKDVAEHLKMSRDEVIQELWGRL